jgi:outer membrane protein assembly factor BamB
MSLRSGNTLPLVLSLLSFLATRPAQAEDWPCWRGPRHDGIARETGLLKQWPTDGPKQLWKADLSGGFSSMAVVDGRLFTQTKENNQEVVVCLDVATGKDLWRYRYDCDYRAHPTFTGGGRPQSRTGPRASPTVDGDRVYTQGAVGTLLFLEAKTGKKVWQQDLLQLAGIKCPTHGYNGSPLIVGEKLFVSLGGPNGKALAALNTRDGSVIWQALDEPMGQASAVWAEGTGAPQVIFFTGTAAVGVSPDDGKLLWRYPWKTQFNLNIATPIYADGKVFVSSNYGTGGAVFRLTGQSEPETIWKSGAMQNHFSNAVLHEGNLYGFSEARLRCVEFQTGKVHWDKPGVGKGSVVLVDGQLIALGEHGELILAQATPAEYREVSRCQVFDKDTLTWTVPVVSGGRLFVRSENALVALDLRGDK